MSADSNSYGRASHFDYRTAARRYARGRPFFHPQAISMIDEFFDLETPLDRVLDIACGTGLSSVALERIAARVVGLDISREMLHLAPADPAIRYLRAAAEALPLSSETFPLVTVSSAFHWLDRPRFLAEARRVLRADGRLVVYDNAFRAHMRENDAFTDWMFTAYLERYPIPPRDRSPFEREDAAAAGFHFLGREDYANEVPFSLDELVNYLTTQTNIIAAVERGAETIEEATTWLHRELEPFFTAPRGTFLFGGPVIYLRKLAEKEQRHREGYARNPVQPGEFSDWEDEQVWPT